MSEGPAFEPRRRPRAFRLPAAEPPDAGAIPAPGPALRPPVTIEPREDPYAREAERIAAGLPEDEAAIEIAQAEGMDRRRGIGWTTLLWSAAGGLASLAAGLLVSNLIEGLFARWVALGWLGLVLAGLLVAALLALALREAIGVFRQGRIARLHQALAAARLADDRAAARSRLAELAALYAHRPELRQARADLAAAATEIIDGRDLIDIAERDLLLPLDGEVTREIAAAARRVSLITAISPRAIFDLLFVAGQIVVLIRRIAEIYSGRPGLFGFLRLARSVGAHLAVTGGMAVGDSLVQQVIGHGLAARLSARLGEGVLNGILTTRVGLSAMAVCRPMPFGVTRQPGVAQVAPFLFGADKRGAQARDAAERNASPPAG